MNTSIAGLTDMIATQATENPAVYGRVDFLITPERFTVDPDSQTELAPELAERRRELLANEGQVSRIRAYTMHGDPVADAYAASYRSMDFSGWSQCWNRPQKKAWTKSRPLHRS